MTSPSEVYRISKGGLVEFGISPAHYQTWLTQPSKRSDALDFGIAYHTAMLEPAKFDEQVRVMPEINRRTNEGKKQYAELMEKAALERITYIDQEDKDKIMAMRQVALSHGMLQQYMARPNKTLPSPIEVRMESTDIDHPNVGLKGRPDFIGDDFIFDYKTVDKPPSARLFKSIVWKYRYDLQAAVYLELARQNGLKVSKFIFGLQEKKPPYSFGLYSISDRDLALTYREMKTLMKLLSKCVEHGHWMMPVESLITMDIRSHNQAQPDEDEADDDPDEVNDRD